MTAYKNSLHTLDFRAHNAHKCAEAWELDSKGLAFICSLVRKPGHASDHHPELPTSTFSPEPHQLAPAEMLQQKGGCGRLPESPEGQQHLGLCRHCPSMLGHSFSLLSSCQKVEFLILHTGEPLLQDEDSQAFSENQSGSTLRSYHNHTG